MVCDCSNPTVKGIIDLSIPKYCDHTEPYHHYKPQRSEHYTIVTKKKDTFFFQGNVCEVWIKEKKITGSFWVGSYDTEFHEYTRFVSQHECRMMVETGLCGKNKMVQIGEMLKYTQEPDGPAKWYDTRKYSTLNCLVTNITLSQEKDRGTIMSPLGEIDNLWYLGYEGFNHKMIIWDIINRTSYEQFVSCEPTELIKGIGTITFTKQHGRLIDKQHQLEILFDVEKKDLCNLKGKESSGHIIFGLPDGYLILKDKLYQRNVRKRRSPWDLVEERNNLNYDIYDTNSYSGVIFQYDHPENYIATNDYSKSLEIKTLKTDEIASIQKPSYEGWPGFLLQKQLLRVWGTNNCVTMPEGRRTLTLGSCDDDPTLWVYDEEDTVITDSVYGNCLTKFENIIGISKCKDINERGNQTWLFWKTEKVFEHNTPMIFDFDRPNELLPSLLEMEGTEETTMPINFDSSAWGRLTNTRNDLCVRVKGESSRLKLKTCGEDFNKGWIQEFELMSDMTLRVIGTDYCVTALHTGRSIHNRKYLRQEQEFSNLPKYEPFSVILEACRLSATRWVYESETTHLIGFDFHTKMSGCLDRVGTDLDYLSLQPCEKRNNTSLKNESTQTWNFEHTNAMAKQPIIPALAKDKHALQAYLRELKRSQNKKFVQLERIIRFGKENRIEAKQVDKERKKRLDWERFSFIEPENPAAPVAESFLQTQDNLRDIPEEATTRVIPTTSPSVTKVRTSSTTIKTTSIRMPTTTSSTAEVGDSQSMSETLSKDDDIKLLFAKTRELIRGELATAHEQFKTGYQVDLANILADEVRQVYCEIAATKRRQLLLLAQISPLLAASTLAKNVSVCGRIEGRGETLIMQQCIPHEVVMKAKLTRCGYEPIFEFGENNRSMTIGIDGWSMRDFRECFHDSNYIGMNGKTFYWHSRYNNIDSGSWYEKNATIHGSQAALVAGFDELLLNDEDFKLFPTNKNNRRDLEKLNLLMELSSRTLEDQLNPSGSLKSFMERDNKGRDNWFGGLSWRNIMQTIGLLIMILTSLFIAVCIIKFCLCCWKTGRIDKLELGKKRKEIEHPPEAPQHIYPSEPIITSIQERWYGIKGGQPDKSLPIEMKQTKI